MKPLLLRTLASALVALTLTGCVGSDDSRAAPYTSPAPAPAAGTAARNFAQVVAQMQPIITQECRERTRKVSCDFRILVDDRADLPANAMQTLDKFDRPVIVFTVALIAQARNVDELAFVLGHEAAHHIEGHIPKTSRTAMTGALVAGVLAAAGGADGATVKAAQELGGTVAARSYAKEFELEADALGTIIAFRAGFDPERGALFFTRIPDPGNRFLGTHPPNAARIAMVRRTMDSLR